MASNFDTIMRWRTRHCRLGKQRLFQRVGVRKLFATERIDYTSTTLPEGWQDVYTVYNFVPISKLFEKSIASFDGNPVYSWNDIHNMGTRFLFMANETGSGGIYCENGRWNFCRGYDEWSEIQTFGKSFKELLCPDGKTGECCLTSEQTSWKSIQRKNGP